MMRSHGNKKHYSSLGQQIFDPDWQLANTNAGGMMDGGCDRGGDAGQANFTDSPRSEGVELLVGEIQEVDFDCRSVGVHGDDIVGQVAVDGRAILRVVVGVLEKGHANSHHYRALDLVASSQWIKDAARVNHGNHSTDAQTG